MQLIIKLFGILMLLIGISVIIDPDIIFGWIENNMENTSLYVSAIVVRLVFGILFIVVANQSRYPVIFKVLGYLFIIAAIVFILIGHESFQDFIATVIPAVKPYARLISVGIIAFGGFLIYSFTGYKEPEQK